MTSPLPYLTRVASGLEPWPSAGMLDLDEFAEYVHDTLIPDLREAGRDATADDFETALHFLASLANDEVRRGGYPGRDVSRFVSQPGDLIRVDPPEEKS